MNRKSLFSLKLRISIRSCHTLALGYRHGLGAGVLRL